MYLGKFSLKLWSVLIFSILNHPCSFIISMVFLQIIILRFPSVKAILQMAEIIQMSWLQNSFKLWKTYSPTCMWSTLYRPISVSVTDFRNHFADGKLHQCYHPTKRNHMWSPRYSRDKTGSRRQGLGLRECWVAHSSWLHRWSTMTSPSNSLIACLLISYCI